MSAQDIAPTGIRARPGDGECPSACSGHRPSAALALWTVPGTGRDIARRATDLGCPRWRCPEGARNRELRLGREHHRRLAAVRRCLQGASMSAQDIASTGVRARTGDSGCPSACSRHRSWAALAPWTVPGAGRDIAAARSRSSASTSDVLEVPGTVNVAEGEHHHDRRRLPPSRPRLAAVAALALWRCLASRTTPVPPVG